jgi:hypothetical protein
MEKYIETDLYTVWSHIIQKMFKINIGQTYWLRNFTIYELNNVEFAYKIFSIY